MAENQNKAGQGRIQKWAEGVKAEFQKIIWPDGTTTSKQTVSTIVISAILALLIVVFDMVIQYGVDFLVSL
ncbi:MAG: preprotein translocase subunit SecE [Lachnospiraceae bacterium]|nr:preprotein translocase subunit SecE [Lachnospiraceae bacterium]